MLRWRREGLLPRRSSRRGPTLFTAVASAHPRGTCAQIRTARRCFGITTAANIAVFRLWRLGFPVAKTLRVLGLDAWSFGRLGSSFYPEFALPRRSRRAGETCRRRWHATPVHRRECRASIKRLERGDLAIFSRVLLESGLGEFERFDALLATKRRSRDEVGGLGHSISEIRKDVGYSARSSI